MPEGDSVYRATARLHHALSGQSLLSSDFRVPALATTDLTGYVVHEVVPAGKHLLMRLHPPTVDSPVFPAKPLTLHSHLLMEGRWDLYSPNERWKKPAHTARVVLRTDAVSAVGFDIAQVRLVPTEQEADLVGHLGPDLLGANWDPALALENLRRDPHQGIGQALLDQRIMAGVGNVYRCEILFLRRLYPLTEVGQIADLPAVVQIAHRLLNVNKDRVRRVTTGQERTREPLWVYGRAGKPCLRCGTRIELLKIPSTPEGAERDCYWCPRCQPAV
ncbi:DNA-formamidopyrimidine glycosylase family protein [Glutamicibacter sp. JC586]|uniref:DNA-formamidopyrimidine glycosylase family protein n=1 Tax=Glutamicibacter sp. JC586 TaxID=2590552 RepID=UPI0013568EF7|nr:DNA-formamidopyrimidine glycosylase family protein [Glutamicibacter sp. JC586]